ncbi:MAG: histone deacetylase, partial [Acidimicrobiia bacterium]
AVARLADGFDGPAFISVRPPGHHALPNRAMGFCLFNNVAITAAGLIHEGNRVAIVDWDVHHGNGTQDIFYEEPSVLYVSIHQSPFYPYQGNPTELGAGAGVGTTLNVPLPAFTAGDVYLEAFEDLAMTAVANYRPDWVLVSSGFDAHAHDPLAEFRLTEADYSHMATLLTDVVAANRIVAFLEGGYHLPALRDSSSAVIRSLLGLGNDLEPSPFRSPEISSRALERVRGAVSGYVPGVA